MKKYVQILPYLSESMIDKLGREARLKKVQISPLFRKAITQYLKRDYPPPTKGAAPFRKYNLRITPEQYQQITERAASMGVSTSWIYNDILKKIMPTPPTEQEFINLIFCDDPHALAAALLMQGYDCTVGWDGMITARNTQTRMGIGLNWKRSDYAYRRTELGNLIYGPPGAIAKLYPTLDQEINRRAMVRKAQS